jgi:hypothetical protein
MSHMFWLGNFLYRTVRVKDKLFQQLTFEFRAASKMNTLRQLISSEGLPSWEEELVLEIKEVCLSLPSIFFFNLINLINSFFPLLFSTLTRSFTRRCYTTWC